MLTAQAVYLSICLSVCSSLSVCVHLSLAVHFAFPILCVHMSVCSSLFVFLCIRLSLCFACTFVCPFDSQSVTPLLRMHLNLPVRVMLPLHSGCLLFVAAILTRLYPLLSLSFSLFYIILLLFRKLLIFPLECLVIKCASGT